MACKLDDSRPAPSLRNPHDLEAILDAIRAIESRLRAQGVHRAVIELRLQLEPHPETLEHQIEGIAE